MLMVCTMFKIKFYSQLELVDMIRHYFSLNKVLYFKAPGRCSSNLKLISWLFGEAEVTGSTLTMSNIIRRDYCVCNLTDTDFLNYTSLLVVLH